MNDRTRAMEVLKQAREVLLARLAERVLDGREDILDDANGYSYSGVIESLHDQLGQRLGNVTALMAHLQSSDETPNHYESAGDLAGSVPEVDTVFGIGMDGYGIEPHVGDEDAAATAEAIHRRPPQKPPAALPDDWVSEVWSAAEAAANITAPSFTVERKNAQEAAPSVRPADAKSTASRAQETLAIEPGAPDMEASAKARRPEQDETRKIAALRPHASSDAGCRDHVFQDADFRSVDLLAAEIEGGMLNPSETGSSDVPAGE